MSSHNLSSNYINQRERDPSAGDLLSLTSEDKDQSKHIDVTNVQNLDAAAIFIAEHGEREAITAEESARVRWKIDIRLLPLMAIMYFLQQLDKSAVSFASVFNIQKDAHLHGQQYAWLTTIVYIAALVGQPASAYALTVFPIHYWISMNFIGWSISQLLMAACTGFKGLIALRFFLGLFEASIAPTMMVTVSMWWTRREQPFRANWWYLFNGFAGIFGSLLTWGVGHSRGTGMHPYQLIFLVIGVISFAFAIPCVFVWPESPIKNRFLTEDEKRIALERVRYNQTGVQGKQFKWKQVWEAFTDLKTLFIVGMVLPHAITAGGVSAFGPLILKSFGYDQFHTILFNMIPGAIQIVLGFLTSFVMMKTKVKAPMLFFVNAVTLAGAIWLWIIPRGKEYTHQLLGAYMLLQFSGIVAPLTFAWANANTGGGTKKSVLASIEWGAVCVGNAIGPQLFTSNSAPYYFPGLRDNIISMAVTEGCVVGLAVWIYFLNRRNKRRREARGMSGDIIDFSLEAESKWAGLREKQAANDQAAGITQTHGQKAFLDLTDLENDEFVYSY
ncbi:hypothetical protein CI109_103918 [Kwoniella shandongensis]|uniref:Uncharacterized protein n=1 Tax=Kwoniella shandongensis TaxID=1734106 RepID=A0A5M6BVN2_9TREE|nr:uncharacterized protein CI109_005628 [Kwoniella shandongensis]KAA5526032.1 hypothetical protein CI109_005628 [Kwoniella shandongensis]